MALWRNIGGLSTIAPGATAFWEISYGGRDVGVVVCAPNILEEFANIELAAIEQGVFAGTNPGEGALPIVYTVRIKNHGSFSLSYNLNIGDWQ
jgi:hypothetical protein